MTIQLPTRSPKIQHLLEEILSLSAIERRSLWHLMPSQAKQEFMAWPETHVVEPATREERISLDQLDIPRGKIFAKMEDFAFPDWPDGDDPDDFLNFLEAERELSIQLSAERFQKQFGEEW
jgi:hypothetical protein